MSNRICPICGTGKCQFRNGVMCGAWICASGLMGGGRNPEGNGYAQGQKVFDEKDMQGDFDLMGLVKMFSGRK